MSAASLVFGARGGASFLRSCEAPRFSKASKKNEDRMMSPERRTLASLNAREGGGRRVLGQALRRGQDEGADETHNWRWRQPQQRHLQRAQRLALPVLRLPRLRHGPHQRLPSAHRAALCPVQEQDVAARLRHRHVPGSAILLERVLQRLRRPAHRGARRPRGTPEPAAERRLDTVRRGREAESQGQRRLSTRRDGQSDEILFGGVVAAKALAGLRQHAALRQKPAVRLRSGRFLRRAGRRARAEAQAATVAPR